MGHESIKIVMREMAVDVRIGLHAHEQEKPQRLLINVDLYAPEGYLNRASRETIIDYDRIYEAVKGWAARPHTLLIETYASELLALCFADAQVQACRVSVMKPDIFPEVQAVGIDVFMTRAEFET